MDNKSQKANAFSSHPSEIRLFVRKVFPYAVSLFIGYMIADIAILSVRSKMFPVDSPPVSGKTRLSKRNKSSEMYNIIVKRNIFNSDGTIPDPLRDEEKPSEDVVEDVNQFTPTLTSLPLELKGTIVHRNPRKSVATIMAKGRKSSNGTSFQVKDKAYDMIEVLAIERRKVIFRNLNSGKKEYVDIPDGRKAAKKSRRGDSKVSNLPEVDSESDNITLKRSDISKYTDNISEILRQARMVPNKGPGGEINGFRFVSIQKGSVYEKLLGFKRGDVIKEVNGQPVNSPSRAMELYNAMKDVGTDKIQIGLERNGVVKNKTYSITD